ncbi:hypothetical protein ACOSP7_000369 [Xanthoceras sorbifolium]
MHVCSHSQKRETEGACPLLQDPQWPESFQTVVNRWERTVIFNARVCCDVDLEVGNLIRIHKPCELFRAGKRFSSSSAIIMAIISSNFCILTPIVVAIDEYKIHRLL